MIDTIKKIEQFIAQLEDAQKRSDELADRIVESIYRLEDMLEKERRSEAGE